jgi:hypothetical protein
MVSIAYKESVGGGCLPIVWLLVCKSERALGRFALEAMSGLCRPLSSSSSSALTFLSAASAPAISALTSSSPSDNSGVNLVSALPFYLRRP